CVGGGIAAYKSCEVARLCGKAGAELRVALTPAAQRFVTALTFQALTGRAASTYLFDAQQELAAGHIALADWAEVVVVALARSELPGTVEPFSAALSLRGLAGVPVLGTAGPKREALDPVRFLSNPSSGRMGFALAEAARDRGAQVTLIAGPTEIAPPAGVRCV